MENYFDFGCNLKSQIKDLVLSYMNNADECSPYKEGLKQAEIFRACGLDWGEQPNATSSQQQYWFVGLLRVLETENKIQRDGSTKKWRIK